MLNYKTPEGELLQGSSSTEILKAYQAGSKFDADKDYETYVTDLWARLHDWETNLTPSPSSFVSLEKEVLKRLVECEFLSEV